jgi:hypothetical protein
MTTMSADTGLDIGRASNAGPKPTPARHAYDLIDDVRDSLRSALRNRDERKWRVLKAIETLQQAAELL